MSSIKNMLPEDCIVLRNNAQKSLPAQELVPGDIVSIKAGNKLPADVRFLQVSSDAKLDRSILTGESVPLTAAVDSSDDNYLETRCIGMQGTHCVSGTCLGVVVVRSPFAISFLKCQHKPPRPSTGQQGNSRRPREGNKMFESIPVANRVYPIGNWRSHRIRSHCDLDPAA